MRPGNTFSGNGAAEFFKECWARLPKQVWKVVVPKLRDAAFFSNAFLCLLEQWGCQYVINCKIKGWKHWTEEHAPWRQSGKGRWTARFEASLHGWRRSRTFMAIRTLVDYKDDNDLFGPQPVYTYHRG